MRWLVFVGMLTAVAGCSDSKSLPPLHPLAGKVMLKGTGPLPGGSLKLKGVADTTLSVVGVIKPDGTFAFKTIGDTDAPGAPPGEYEFEIIGPLADQQQPMKLKILSPAKIKVEPKDNDVTIEVQRVK